jgi:hypothetical protein
MKKSSPKGGGFNFGSRAYFSNLPQSNSKEECFLTVSAVSSLNNFHISGSSFLTPENFENQFKNKHSLFILFFIFLVPYQGARINK